VSKFSLLMPGMAGRTVLIMGRMYEGIKQNIIYLDIAFYYKKYRTTKDISFPCLGFTSIAVLTHKIHNQQGAGIFKSI
jgi:hypothetical protein